MTSVVTVRLLIEGRVQGVSYRKWAVNQAQALGLSGWVRNRREGSVELVMRGTEAKTQEMQEACHRGPFMARVTSVQASPSLEPVHEGFEQRATV